MNNLPPNQVFCWIASQTPYATKPCHSGFSLFQKQLLLISYIIHHTQMHFHDFIHRFPLTHTIYTSTMYHPEPLKCDISSAHQCLLDGIVLSLIIYIHHKANNQNTYATKELKLRWEDSTLYSGKRQTETLKSNRKEVSLQY